MTIAINILATVLCLAVHIKDKSILFAMLALTNAICFGINIGKML